MSIFEKNIELNANIVVPLSLQSGTYNFTVVSPDGADVYLSLTEDFTSYKAFSKPIEFSIEAGQTIYLKSNKNCIVNYNNYMVSKEVPAAVNTIQSKINITKTPTSLVLQPGVYNIYAEDCKNTFYISLDDTSISQARLIKTDDIQLSIETVTTIYLSLNTDDINKEAVIHYNNMFVIKSGSSGPTPPPVTDAVVKNFDGTQTITDPNGNTLELKTTSKYSSIKGRHKTADGLAEKVIEIGADPNNAFIAWYDSGWKKLLFTSSELVEFEDYVLFRGVKEPQELNDVANKRYVDRKAALELSNTFTESQFIGCKTTGLSSAKEVLLEVNSTSNQSTIKSSSFDISSANRNYLALQSSRTDNALQWKTGSNVNELVFVSQTELQFTTPVTIKNIIPEAPKVIIGNTQILTEEDRVVMKSKNGVQINGGVLRYVYTNVPTVTNDNEIPSLGQIKKLIASMIDAALQQRG